MKKETSELQRAQEALAEARRRYVAAREVYNNARIERIKRGESVGHSILQDADLLSAQRREGVLIHNAEIDLRAGLLR